MILDQVLDFFYSIPVPTVTEAGYLFAGAAAAATGALVQNRRISRLRRRHSVFRPLCFGLFGDYQECNICPHGFDCKKLWRLTAQGVMGERLIKVHGAQPQQEPEDSGEEVDFSLREKIADSVKTGAGKIKERVTSAKRRREEAIERERNKPVFEKPQRGVSPPQVEQPEEETVQ